MVAIIIRKGQDIVSVWLFCIRVNVIFLTLARIVIGKSGVCGVKLSKNVKNV